MDEIFHFIKNILFEEEIYEEENINENSLISNNNNDAFIFLVTIFMYFKLFIYAIYDCFLFFISSLTDYLYKFQYILLLTLFLFSFVATFQDNSNITTDLIISAYFPKKKITRMTKEMNLQKEIKNEKIIKITNNNNIINIKINNYKKYEYLEQNNSNENKIIKDLICDIIKEKNCNYSKYNMDERKKNDTLEFNQNNEIYFLNFIPIKNLLITITCFIFLYSFIKKTRQSKIRCSLLLNFFSMIFLFNLITNLYKNKYYLASNFIFISLIYTNKNLIDSVYLKLKFKRKDFEILTSNLIAINSRQFFLKIILLINSTILSATLSILFFKFWLNYIVNYLCLLTLISFLGNCLEQISTNHLKPIKNIIMFFIGIFNLILSKLILKYFLFKEKTYENYNCFINDNNEKIYCKKDINNINIHSNDSLYLINDLFSLFCLDYINGFLEYQLKFIISGKKNVVCNYICYFLFIIVILIGYLGIYIQEFICLFISLYLAQTMMYNFRKIFNYKICRIFNFLIILKYLIFIQRMIKIRDNYFINILLSLTNLNEVILLFSIKFIYLLCFFYYIITNNFAFYVIYNSIKVNQIIDDNYNNNSKVFNLIYIILEVFLQYLIFCIIIIIYIFYENKFIFKILYLLIVIIFHSLKISTINEIKIMNKDNKTIINYNIFIFIWIIISLRLIRLSCSQISLIYLINHLNLILIINFYILNDIKNDNFFKIIILLLLLIGYYSLNSSIFIIDAIAIVISPIIKNLKNNNNQIIKNKEEKIKIENLKAYNRLSFLFAISIILFSLVQIGYINNYDVLEKYYKDLLYNINILFKGNNDRKNFDENEVIEYFIISKFLN